MPDLRTQLGNAARAGACTLLGIPDAIDRLVDFPSNGFGILGQLDDFTDGVRNGLRDAICPSPADNPYGPGLPTPILPPQQPAPPGQCEGVEYIVQATATGIGNNGVPDTASTAVSVNGPIFAAFVDLDRPSQSSQAFFGVLYLATGGVNTPTQSTSNSIVQRKLAAGDAPAGFFEAPDRRLTAWGMAISIFGPNESITTDSINVTRVDGLPDDCGTPPPLEPPRIEDPIEYEPPTGPPVTISPVLVFNPIRIDIRNNVIIPINILYNDVDITANLNLNIGTIEFNFGGGKGDGGECCPPPQLPELPPDDPEDIPPPDNEERIAGVVVTVTTVSNEANFTEVGVPSGPAMYFPDLGTVMFRIRTEGVLSWTAPIRIQNRRQFIPVPWREGAVDVAAQAREGVNFTLTIVYDDFAQLP